MIHQYLNNKLNQPEKEAFENKSEYGHILRLMNRVKLNQPTPKQVDIYQKAVNAPIHKKLRINTTTPKLWYAVAASLLIVFTLSAVLVYQNQTAYTTEFAANHQTEDFLLPDESEVTLYSDSKIEYQKNKWDNNRSLTLDGQAYFEVKKGSKFTVRSGAGEVEVLGTKFEVKSRGNQLFVTCYEGKVKVTTKNQINYLTAGNQLFFDANNNQLPTTPTTAVSQPVWLEGNLKFNSAPLNKVIHDLQKQFGWEIIADSTVNLDTEFSGKFFLEDTQDIVAKTLANSFNLQYTIQGNQIKLYYQPTTQN